MSGLRRFAGKIITVAIAAADLFVIFGVPWQPDFAVVRDRWVVVILALLSLAGSYAAGWCDRGEEWEGRYSETVTKLKSGYEGRVSSLKQGYRERDARRERALAAKGREYQAGLEARDHEWQARLRERDHEWQAELEAKEHEWQAQAAKRDHEWQDRLRERDHEITRLRAELDNARARTRADVLELMEDLARDGLLPKDAITDAVREALGAGVDALLGERGVLTAGDLADAILSEDEVRDIFHNA